MKRARATAAGATTVRLRVKPRGKKRARLGERGKVKVKVTFRPVGGAPRTLAKRVRLVKRGR